MFLQPSPFWGWDPPQSEYPEAPGFTEVSTEANGVTLRADQTVHVLVPVAAHRNQDLHEAARLNRAFLAASFSRAAFVFSALIRSTSSAIFGSFMLGSASIAWTNSGEA